MRFKALPLYVTLAAFAVSANAVPPLLSTLAAKLSLPAWTLGVGMTLQYVFFFAISWLGGLFTARRGIRHHVIILTGLCVLSLALALAPVLLSSLPAILLWMCVLGLAGGSVETFASISLTADAHSASSKPLCISQAFYSIGAFVAPQAASLFLGRPGGWKPACLVLAALALSMTLFFTVFGREPARATVAVKSANKTGARDDAATARGNSVLSFRALLFAYVMVEALCASWLPYMLENRRGFGAGEAASTASFYWLGMIAGRMAVTLLPDRLTLRPALIVSSLLAVMAAFTVFMFPGSSLIPLAVLGFAMGPIWPITVRMAAATLRSDSLTASVIAVGGLGAAAGPLFGSLLLAWGLAHLYFPALALFCLAVAAMIMVASVPRKVGKP